MNVGGEVPRTWWQRAGWVFLLAIGLGTADGVLVTEAAHGDNIPDSPWKGPDYYYTDKMDPIEVAFWGRFRERGDRPPDLIATLPRGYIFSAPGYSQEEYEELPSRIEVKTLSLLFSYPDGLAHKTSQSRYKRYVKVQDKKIKEYRFRQYRATLHPAVKNLYEADTFLPEEYQALKRESLYERYIGNFDGFRGYRGGGSARYYYGDINSDIRRARCWNDVEKAHPTFFCSYITLINAHMYAEVSFMDFRMHGGAEFAEERIRVFKQILCRHVPCDDPEARYNSPHLRWPQ